MSTFLNIWFIGLILFSLVISFHYRNKSGDRLSFGGSLFILIFWPLTFISILFLLILIWIEERCEPNDDIHIHVVIKNKEDAKK
ncbi:hypothetical protein [Providencia sp. PROV160]|uniref:hypothetical protein n=1 Tax=Providencia sp. PROV160 TaxID=2949869 RepID=UPI002349862A|nr:hypothetical protein [Providencia sp. PROV160]